MPLRRTRAATPQRGGPITPIHRGPQAATLPAAAPIPYHAPNAALLIDFDNVTMGIRSDLASELKSLLSSDIVRGKVSVQRAYADWRRYPQYIVPLSESSIDLIFAPAYGSSKKNATDIRLAIDALELVFTRPEIGTFILLSGDSDFSSLVIKLKEYGKYVIGVGIRESSSELLVQNCDEYYSYNALAGLVNTREEEVVKWDPWELASEAVQRMKRGGDVMRADRLKQVMQQIDSSFDEKNLGMAKFSRFVTEAAQRGILSLHKMENGQYEVDLPKEKGEGTAPAPSEVPVAERNGDESVASDERRGRGRRGRGRGREGPREERREPRPAVAAEPQPIVAESRPSMPAVSPPAALHEAPTPTPVPTGADAIGVSGLRLTRDEAFDLVRRAVAAAGGNGAPARASDIRRVARELLGRDSESLSERNFIRILQDAHDADVIDLRRRGDDYDVSPAVAAAPIAEQLDLQTAASASTAQASAAATAATPRGMAPRGVMGRSRGPATKGKGLPTDLLSVGVVDDTLSATPVLSTIAPVASSAATPNAEALEAETADAAPEGKGRARRGRKTATATKSAAKKSAGKTARKRTAS